MAKTKKAKAKTVRVRFTARQVVHYDKTVEMSKDEWAAFKSLSRSEACKRLWIDTHDICYAEDIEEDDFDAEVVDARNKPVLPWNRYVGGYGNVEED